MKTFDCKRNATKSGVRAESGLVPEPAREVRVAARTVETEEGLKERSRNSMQAAKEASRRVCTACAASNKLETTLLNLSLTRPNTLVHTVTERLREAIVTAEVKLGEPVSEEKLAAAFGVSRTPVREALNLLQLQGLVEIAPQRGSFVFRPTQEDIADLCEYRISMEMTVIPLCAKNDHPATLAALKACLKKMETALAEDDGLAYATLDDELHQLFFRHCGNKYFQDAYALIAGRISALRNNLTKDYRADHTVSMEEHRQIVQLFAAREFDGIGTVLHGHIGRTEENFLRALENGVF